MATARETGAWAEQLAQQHLKQQNIDILCTNFTTRYGEIDIIGLQDACLLFIEVRYRQSERFGGAISSINLQKQQRLHTTAQIFLQQNPVHNRRTMRFDAIIIAAQPNTRSYTLEWLKNAFEN